MTSFWIKDRNAQYCITWREVEGSELVVRGHNLSGLPALHHRQGFIVKTVFRIHVDIKKSDPALDGKKISSKSTLFAFQEVKIRVSDPELVESAYFLTHRSRFMLSDWPDVLSLRPHLDLKEILKKKAASRLFKSLQGNGNGISARTISVYDFAAAPGRQKVPWKAGTVGG